MKQIDRLNENLEDETETNTMYDIENNELRDENNIQDIQQKRGNCYEEK